MLLRLLHIADGLRARGLADDADALGQVIAQLKARTPRTASLQEILLRTLTAVVRHSVTIDGRLIDVLGHLAVVHALPLGMHPAVLIAIRLGSRSNPDREHHGAVLDSLLSVLVETQTEYKTALYTAATLARQYGLIATSEAAVELLHQLEHDETQQEQAERITALIKRPDTAHDDDLGWITKLLLTMATIAAVGALASKLLGGFDELMAGIDIVLGGGE